MRTYVPVVWSMCEVKTVQALIERGWADQEIAQATRVPRSTVNRWRRQPPSGRRRRHPPSSDPWRPPDRGAYSYLLGMYLGDGCISERSGWSELQLSLDARHAAVAQQCTDALLATVPEARVRRCERREKHVLVLRVSSPRWPEIFPQHGLGRKHTRRIELLPWQCELTERYPRELLRGLIHSDGCRTVNRFSVRLPSGRVGHYEYVRYFFSNLSADIRRIFCEHCDLLGIRWTQSNPRNISIAHRESVGLLDSFVGAKA